MQGVKRTGKSYHPLYGTWSAMLKRCFNSNHSHFHRYGGRGITVCERWMNFENFAKDMGSRPEGMTLDRINNDSNYSPDNCRWASQLEQVKNRNFHKHLFNGKKLTIPEISEIVGASAKMLRSRIKKGMSINEAVGDALKPKIRRDPVDVNFPKIKGPYKNVIKVNVNGELLTIREITHRYNIPATTLRSRIYRGWNVSDLVK